MLRHFFGISLLLVLMFASTATAQSATHTMHRNDGQQFYEGSIQNLTDEIVIHLQNLQVGDTVYAQVTVTDDMIPVLLVADAQLTNLFSDSTNNTLQYTVTEAGDYALGLLAVSGLGTYQLQVSINESLQSPTFAGLSLIGEPDNEPPLVDGLIQEFTGEFVDATEEVVIPLSDLQAGDTIYIYAAGVGFVDTYIYVEDGRGLNVYAEDDNSGGGFNSALSFEVPESGNYQIGLITIDSIGSYRMVVGVNAPEVLDSANDASLAALPEREPFVCDDAEYGDRPILSGVVKTLEGDAFIVHYTLTGRDSSTDEYASVLAEAIQRSLDVQFNELGWARPPDDCGEGGDSRLDVYVQDISRVRASGIARRENVVGDNPYTGTPEYYAAYSYLVIDNDMNGRDLEETYDLLRTTAAHEVHHNIQFGYDVNDRYFGIYEAGASWIETLVYPALTNVYARVDDMFRNPDLCIGYETGGDLRVYGEWVMIDSFTRDLGRESYRFIWEYMARGEGLDGFYTALEALGTTPEEVILRTAVRDLLKDYALAKDFETEVAVEAIANGIGFISPRRDGVQQLSVDYIELRARGRFTFQLVDDTNLAMYLVGINATDGTARLYDLGSNGTVDTLEYNYAYLIVLNTERHENSDSCEERDWAIQVFAGEGDPLTMPTNEIWDATQFIPTRR